MLKSYLDFEQPIADLEQKILDLKDSDLDEGAIQSEVIRLNESIIKTTEKIYSDLSPWQNVQVARHPDRPHFLDYSKGLTGNFIPLSGDRSFGEDSAIIGGIAKIDGASVMLIGHEKGFNTEAAWEAHFVKYIV